MAVRTLVLIRHGQYHLDQEHPRYGLLTPLGRRQARRVGTRLAQWPIDALHSSNAPRAIETAQLIAARLRDLSHRPTGLLVEGLPTVLPMFTPEQRERVPGHRARMDRAFARFFRPTRGRDRLEALVCHGNIIRYLLCRALGGSVDHWWRFQTYHCGISVVAIPPDGSMRIVSVNDVGFLTRALTSE